MGTANYIMISLKTNFTFQYGSTLIKYTDGTSETKTTFTFQYGSTLIAVNRSEVVSA